MSDFRDWRDRLGFIDTLMRAISSISDPQEMVRVYADGLDRLYPVRRLVTVSRRELSAPQYRITRSWLWEGQEINPWTEKHRLPLLSSGLLGELIYGNKPVLLDSLEISPHDPAYEHLKGSKALFALAQYDNGEALNMAIMLFDDPASIPRDLLPTMHWQGNLFGRATRNMVLSQELDKAYQTLDRELKVVGEMQRSLLPAELPSVPGLTLAAQYETSARAGGDYYDVFPLPDGEWGLFIADVSGHGTPAAVTMAITHALAHGFPGPPAPPSAMLRHLNDKLSNRYTLDNGQFVTAFYCIYNPKTRRLIYSSAGHNPPRIARDGKVLSLDDAVGWPLGVSPDADYPERTITLSDCDLLLLYTDGIVEAADGEGGMYGVERLDELLLSSCHTPAGAIEAINRDVAAYTKNAPLLDDRTLLAARVCGDA